jgi:hypothetical protein
MGVKKPEGWALEKISRRKALKRVAAGTAVAWSAPVLTSVSAPAFATHRYDVCTGHELVDCDPATVTLCGDPGTCPPPCACVRTVDGPSTCINQWFCGQIGSGCTSNAQCDAVFAGSVCVPAGGSCCPTSECAPRCGTCPVGPESPEGARKGIPI